MTYKGGGVTDVRTQVQIPLWDNSKTCNHSRGMHISDSWANCSTHIPHTHSLCVWEYNVTVTAWGVIPPSCWGLIHSQALSFLLWQ